MPLSSLDLLRVRQRNQRLAGTTLRTPLQVVSWLGAVQSQDYPGAKWALGLRATSLTDAAVERVFDDGTILRTHVLRPTWHFVAPADIRWMLSLTGPRVAARMAPYLRKREIDRAMVARSRKVFERTLRDGTFLTRAELGSALARAGISAQGERLGHVVMDAEVQGVICSGPRRGKQFTYALLEERVPPAPTLTREEGLATLAARYFTSHGPASVRDFVWWSGLTVGDARAGLATLAPAVREEVVAGVTCWSLASRASGRPLPRSAHLLPNYDEYLIAYQDRGFAVTPVDVRDFDVYGYWLIIDGHLAGTWRRTVGRDRVTVVVKPYRPLGATERKLVAAAAERHAAFMSLPVTLSIG